MPVLFLASSDIEFNSVKGALTESIGYYHNYTVIIMMCNRVSNLMHQMSCWLIFGFLVGPQSSEAVVCEID